MKRCLYCGVLFCVLSCFFLAGCVITPELPVAELPMSQKTPVSEAQNRAKIHTDLGVLYFQAGKMPIALEEAGKAISVDASYAPAYNLMGLVHVFLNENVIAAADFERAISLAPNDPEINNNYAWFLCQTGHEREAIQRFIRAAKNTLYTTPAKPYTNAGLCALRLKDGNAAEGYFQQAVMFDTKNAQAYYHLAAINYQRGNDENARRLVSEVHRLREPTAESLWLALRIERKLGDRQAELGFVSQLRRKFPGTKEYESLIQGSFE